MRKQWRLAACDKDKAAQLSESCGLDPFLALLLTSRGIADAEAAADYLAEDGSPESPFLLTDMDKAVARIRQAIDSFEKIAVFGDYDADGVTATALLYSYLETQGADVLWYIPDRQTEGYGISKPAIKALFDRGVRLLITVDNGISALEEAEYARDLGMEVVITDHHTPGARLPQAVAVVNPHRAESAAAFQDSAGVGVALKLACALEGDAETVLEQYADLAAIGTLADVMPLVGENRALVRRGLRQIQHSPRAGIAALLAAAGASERAVTAATVAFTLAPRINAAGRIGNAETALRLLLCETQEDAEETARLLDEMNRRRQEIETEICEQAIAQIEADPAIRYARILVVAGENWHAGVIGIVAARLVSRYGKPAVVISLDGETGKGSCRSIAGFSIYDALAACADCLTHFGGHPGAAGLGIKSENTNALRSALDAYAKGTEMPFVQICLDFKLNPAYIGLPLLDTLAALEPCGSANPAPVFGLYKMRLCAVKTVGEGKHLRLTLQKGGAEITAMLFAVSPAQFPYCIGDIVDLAVKIEKNVFRGVVRPAIHIQEMRFSDTDEDNYLKSMRLYEKYRHGETLTPREAAFLTPSTAFLRGVCRFMQMQGTFSFSPEVFCKRSGCPFANAGTAAVAFDVLTELGVLTDSPAEGYRYNIHTPKIDPDTSEILQKLRQEGA